MEKTLQTAVVYQTYSVALNLLNKTLLILAERGADQRTLNFLVQTINTLILQINEYAGELALEKKWNEDLNDICHKYHINRALKEDEKGGGGKV
jgi:hypothetical protein